jgi:TolA-binding protein
MKKLMIIIPITGMIAVIFGAMLAASIGTLESVYAQTNATNATTNTTTGVGSASEIENLTGGTQGNTGLLQNSSDISSPSTGLTQGLEKEQTADTEGNMTAADKTAGQNATTAGGGNATTTGNNTNANQTSSENKTGNPLSNVPIIGQFFK